MGSNLILVIIGGLLYLGVTFGIILASIDSIKPRQTQSVDSNHRQAVLEGPSWVYVNPDLDELIIELKTKKEQLKRKEEELKLWELQIQKEMVNLRSITNRVHLLQNDFEETANTLSDSEEENIRRLLSLFKTFQPSQTASILEPMSDEKIAKIFRLLKPSEVGPIVQLWLANGGKDEERVHKILQIYQGIIPEKEISKSTNNS